MINKETKVTHLHQLIPDWLGNAIPGLLFDGKLPLPQEKYIGGEGKVSFEMQFGISYEDLSREPDAEVSDLLELIPKLRDMFLAERGRVVQKLTEEGVVNDEDSIDRILKTLNELFRFLKEEGGFTDPAKFPELKAQWEKNNLSEAHVEPTKVQENESISRK